MKVLTQNVPGAGSPFGGAPPKKRKYDAVSARRTRRINKQRALEGKPPLRRQRKTNRKYVYSGKYVKDPEKARKFKGPLGKRMRSLKKNLSSGKVSTWLEDAKSQKEKGSDKGVLSKVRAPTARGPPVEV